MIDAKAFLGVPFWFQDLFQIYPPTVGDVIINDKALAGYRLLTFTQEDIEDNVKKSPNLEKLNIPTPLEFILINSYNNPEFNGFVQSAFELFLHMDFIPVYEQRMILLGKAENINDLDTSKMKFLTEENFFDFQNGLRRAMGDKQVDPLPTDLNPIALRVYKAGRKRERAARNKKNGVSVGEILCSICCRGVGINPLNIREISYASAINLSSMLSRKEKYQTDLETILAGADPKKVKPKYWIREDSDYQEVQI